MTNLNVLRTVPAEEMAKAITYTAYQNICCKMCKVQNYEDCSEYVCADKVEEWLLSERDEDFWEQWHKRFSY